MKAVPYLNILAPQTEDYTTLVEKVKFLEENGKRKEMEIEKLRAQVEENVDLKGRIQKTEKKLEGLEKLIREALSQT